MIRVAAQGDVNKMQINNLGIVFGPVRTQPLVVTCADFASTARADVGEYYHGLPFPKQVEHAFALDLADVAVLLRNSFEIATFSAAIN